MRARRVATVALLTCVAAPMSAAPVSAVQDPTTGYWTRTNVGAPVPLQPPDPAPEGGSWVSGDPAGPVAVTAIRAVADGGNVVAGLRLTIADAIGPVAVLVCPTLDRWAPDQGGRLEAAPDADCSSPVEAVVEEDVLVVDLPADLQADVADLLLTPAPDSAFSVTFEPATAESVVQAPEGGGLDDVGSFPPTTTGEDFAPPPGSDSGFAGGSDFGIPELGTPATAPEPLLPAPALPEPAAEPVPQPQAAPEAPVELAGAPPVVVDDRPVALLATALLTMLGVLAVRLALQPAPAPRRLGGTARLTRPEVAAAPVVDSPQRGVGRFRAVRHRPPVQI